MNQTNAIRHMKILLCTAIFTILCTITIWAGTWETTESGRYKYKNDDGTYLVNTWLQENGKWYFLDENGLLVVNGTVEGYLLGADGAEISGMAAITSQYAQVAVPAAGQQGATGEQASAGQQGTTGEQASAGQQGTTGKQASAGQRASSVKQTAPETEVAAETAAVTYVLNKNTKKFHKPGCSSVRDMAAKNRLDSDSSREEVIAQGYVPCKRCKP